MLRGIFLSLFLLVSFSSYAEEEIDITQWDNVESYTQWENEIGSLKDFTKKDELVSNCVSEYIRRQSKSYAKIVQNNLYDLIHNFDRITSKIKGKKGNTDEVSYNEKIGTLAKVQCEIYFNMGMLK